MSYKITRMLMEDVIKNFWQGDYPLDSLVCKKDGFEAHHLTGVSVHMKKEHGIYIARNRGVKRSLYHSHNLLPESDSKWHIRLPENAL